MKTICIVEDDLDIHNMIKEMLEKASYHVISAYSGTEALLLLEKVTIHLLLLDLMLPGLNGEAIIQKVNHIPIIVMSAKTSTEDKVQALSMGANDYITKPFQKEELLARIQVQLRINEGKVENKELQYKDMVLKEKSHTIQVEGKPLYLTKTEYAIVKQLLLHPNQVITKSALLENISKETLDGDENSLKVHISNIRKKIRTITPEEYIEAVWGIGFKMHV